MRRPHDTWAALGLSIGHATDADGATGCTVIRGRDAPFRCAAALVGRASATRELGTCAPEHLVDRTDALLLTGGSAYGLDAASGVMRWMEERGRGFRVGGGVVPIVPAAAIYDLAPLGRFSARPDAAMAYAACENSSATDIGEGSIGAGTGALVGKGAGVERAMKGGTGLGAAHGADEFAAAIAVVNAFGDVRDGDGRIIAGARADTTGDGTQSRRVRDIEFLDIEARARSGELSSRFPSASREHTTLACIAVSVPLDKMQLTQLATAATAALHRRITPVATAFDGDVIFAIAPMHDGQSTVSRGQAVALPVLEVLATHALEQAIERAVRTAHGRDGFPGLADHQPNDTSQRDTHA
jgi:L-aminopeptidase/D-esterase-like protein